jgi:hypothetical protein
MPQSQVTIPAALFETKTPLTSCLASFLRNMVIIETLKSISPTSLEKWYLRSPMYAVHG